MLNLKRTGPVRCFLPVVAFLLCAMPAQANPVPVPGPSQEILRTGIPIFLEAICVVFLLRRFRKPEHFLWWILGMHLLTYPLFIVLCFGFRPLLYGPYFLFVEHPVPRTLNVTLAEAVIVLIEAGLIYLMCRVLRSRSDALPAAS